MQVQHPARPPRGGPARTAVAPRGAAPGRRGNATVVAVIVLFVIGSMAGVVLSVTQRRNAEVKALADQSRAFFVAQSAINDVLASLDAERLELPDEGEVVSVGSLGAPEIAHGGRYWVDVEGDGEEQWVLTAHARAGMQEKSIEVVVESAVSPLTSSAVFAGNSTGDAGYVLSLAGAGGRGDVVFGDVYSGGDVRLAGRAEVLGAIRARGEVAGASASPVETDVPFVLPDIAGMDYESTADVDVAHAFSTGGATYELDSVGGSAWQLPPDNPAHVFRKNPSDRARETAHTVKDDYFLEDPHGAFREERDSESAEVHGVTLSGVSGAVGPSSNGTVFFVDGNLWVHNLGTGALRIQHDEPGGVQVTFVAKGNVYIADDVLYANEERDGVAFVAMRDPAVEDSGNVYLGDPEFGTLASVSAFLYAENDCRGLDLYGSGSACIELHGRLTAGNHVRLERERAGQRGGGVEAIPRLVVDLDERIEQGSLALPGLPRPRSDGASLFRVLSWREIED